MASNQQDYRACHIADVAIRMLSSSREDVIV